MNNHYIPRLLLRPFAAGGRINTYDFASRSFCCKKLKDAFAAADLFDDELEKQFANKLEGPFGNLLHHKLLDKEEIRLNRQENLLLRKFLLIHFLRAPIINTSWDEMVERTRMQHHPSVETRAFLLRHHPELKELFEESLPSSANYITNLKKAMEIDSLEDIAKGREELSISTSLKYAARMVMASVIAFWDVSDTDQEFILPKLPKISEMDQISIFHKYLVLENRRKQLEEEWLPDDLLCEVQRLQYGSTVFSDNYSVYPIAPTRAVVCFSPYFRGFFPIRDAAGRKIVYRPLLNREQFERHFFHAPRMELFEPCKVVFNQNYTYMVKQLSVEELHHINAMLLDMETEEFAFYDIHKIRDSLKYYDNDAVFAYEKKHDFSKLYE